jgi:hypothetical protein
MLTLWRDFEFCLIFCDKCLEIDTFQEEFEILCSRSSLKYMRKLFIDDTVVKFTDY